MAVEQLFDTFKEGDRQGYSRSGYDPSDPESYEPFIQAMIKDSKDYEGSVLAPARDTAQKYYYGMLPSLNPDGTPYSDTQIIQDPTATYEQILGGDEESAYKSQYVSSDVRDAVMLIMPSLIRLFGASENVVNLVPRTEADVQTAEQQTNYINYVFWQDNPGFLILHGAFKDAMTVKTGFVKWWTDDHREVRTKTYVNLPAGQINVIMGQDQTAKIVHLGDLDKRTQTYDQVMFTYEVDKPLIKVAGVPPEEMRLDRYARSFQTSRIVGHQRLVAVEDLTAMGYDRELCLEYLQGQMVNEFTMESQLRNPGRNISTRVGDGVQYGEFYIRVDKDGDGTAELRYICTMGETAQIVHDEPANRIRFAVFGVDPRSHTIVGDSLADYTEDIQKIKTNMWRGVLDSLAESINPKTVMNELTTNVDDAMNDEIGAVIRTRGDPRAAVSFVQIPFAGQQAMPVLEMLNDQLQRRTGLSDAAKGLDPKALQSSTQIGVEAVINGQQERIELIARVLAETGFRDLFTGLYNEISEAPNQRRTLRINGSWTDVDTGSFDASMGVEVNSTLGKGSDMVRYGTLQQIITKQEMIMQQFGPTNPMVSPVEYMNSLTDLLALANIKNPGRYFKPIDPQVLQQMAAQPKEPDAMTLAAKAQYEKVKADTAKAIAEQQLKSQKQQQDDQFRYTALHQKADYEQQKIDVERMKAGAPSQNPTDNDLEAHKLAVDVHKAHLDAAMQQRKMQLDAATSAAEIDQKREAGQQQAETALATAAMRPPPGQGQGGNK
jgi:hypothetical protein